MMFSDAADVTSCCVGSGSGGENKRRRTEVTLQNSREEMREEQIHTLALATHSIPKWSTDRDN
jgi:hypothetical protein